jgi:hypothetical protein
MNAKHKADDNDDTMLRKPASEHVNERCHARAVCANESRDVESFIAMNSK